MPVRVWFDLTAVLALAEHAAAAGEHAPTHGQRVEGVTPTAALWWITYPGEGSYLMSNGLPAPAGGPAQPWRAEPGAYAIGYGHTTTAETLTRAGLPTDGLARVLTLTEPGHAPLLVLLRTRQWAGHTRLTLDADEPTPGLGSATPHPSRPGRWLHLPL